MRRPHVLVGLGCAVVATGLLALLPVVAADDPSLAPTPAPGDGSWWLLLAAVVAQALAVVWVGRRPELLLAIAGVTLLPAAATPTAAFSVTAVGVLVGVFLVVLARRPLHRAALLLLPTAVVVAAGQALNDLGLGAGLGPAPLQALVVVGLPVLPALVVATQRETREARRQEVLALHREQEALATAVAARERTAMSRELHDIAAHHLSGIAVLAAALDRQIDDDPPTARRSAALLREQSRAVLDDLRRIVGLLREGPDPDPPAETVEGVAGLVEARRATGVDVELARRGDGPEPGPLARLVVHRMVQESLANAAHHAPGARCAVSVDRADDRLVVTVVNDAPTGPPPGTGGGFGLVGMAERARLVGGELTYGPTAAGGWEVRLTVPVEEVTP